MLWVRVMAAVMAILLMAVMIGVSGQSQPSTLPTTYADPSLYHVTSFIFLTLLVGLALSWLHPLVGIFISVLWSLGFGTGDEAYQSSVTGRDASVADLRLDYLGTTIGMLVLIPTLWVASKCEVVKRRGR